MYIVFSSSFFTPQFDELLYMVSRQDAKGGRRKEYF